MRRDAHALYLAARDPRVPWPAKLVAAGIAGYALSPLDLIPDFIPVVGLLDDLLIVPAGIFLVVRLIPKAILAEHRAAAMAAAESPRARRAAAAVIATWVVVTGIAVSFTAAYLLG